MSGDHGPETWKPVFRRDDGPLYLAIAATLAQDIKTGVLMPGQRLPPQRALADAIGVDLTTVSRAYTAARKSGLIEGRVGQGTYVRAQAENPTGSGQGDAVDMSMNMPPRFNDQQLAREMWSVFDGIERLEGLDILMRYQEPGGTPRDRAAGASWLGARLDHPTPERVQLCAGVQGALMATLGLLIQAGDGVCCDALTYPGFIAIAEHLQLRLLPVEMDANGILPESFAHICATQTPKALYLVPTLHNPTTATLPLDRRERLADIARHYNVPILEDDAYGALATQAPPPMACLAPDMTWHISSLSKCLAPALRLAILLPPAGSNRMALQKAVRATGAMVSPLSARAATTWIETGTAGQIVAAIRTETHIRQNIVRDVLPTAKLAADAFHCWLQVPDHWPLTAFVNRLRDGGVSVVPSSAFAVGPAPNAIRIGLGAAHSAAQLRTSLATISTVLNTEQDGAWMVV